jgi:hypothetical protein
MSGPIDDVELRAVKLSAQKRIAVPRQPRGRFDQTGAVLINLQFEMKRAAREPRRSTFSA